MVTEVGKRLVVLDPTSGPVVEPVHLAPPVTDLSGKTVGLLSNSKAGSVELLDHISRLLEQQFRDVKFVRKMKPNASRPVPDDMAAELITQCNLVITATGDWGSCSTCSMHDGIEFEKHGIPAAVVCTNEFINAARAMAEVAGLPGYPFAVVEHPVGSATDEERLAKAKAALPQLLEILSKR